MGLFSFKSDAGEEIINRANNTDQKTELILNHLKKHNLIPEGLSASLEGSKLMLSGDVESQQAKNRILATAGNIQGISQVEDRIGIKNIAAQEEQAQDELLTKNEGDEGIDIDNLDGFYTVKKGDYLSKIARQVYGDGNKYPIIFEANTPMLKDADRIYPGQVLVIPELDTEMK